MNSLSHLSRCWLLTGFVLCLLLPGCGGEPTARSTKIADTGRSNDPVEVACEVLRKDVDLGRCQQVVRVLNSHISQTLSLRNQLQADDKANDLLTKTFGLSAEELDYLKQPLFTSLDAYHLESCFRMQEVEATLRAEKLSPLQQAELAFAWVMREVTLDTQSDEVLPPSFVLLRGSGNALERALVFLALLEQLELPGCMLGLPEDGGKVRLWAPAVLVNAEKQKPQLHVFDTRLGTPIAGIAGKGIATLAELQSEAALLQALAPYDLSAEQLAKVELYLVGALPGLSQRMHFLQEKFNQHGQIRLTQPPAQRWQDWQHANVGKLNVWQPAEKQRLALLRPPPSVLVKATQQTDISAWLDSYKPDPFPHFAVEEHLRSLRLWDNRDFPEAARTQLLKLPQTLYTQYVVTGRERLTRGHYLDLVKPLVRIRGVLWDYEESRVRADQMDALVAPWRGAITNAYLAKARNLPGADQRIQAFWTHDEYLQLVLRGDEVDAKDRQKRTVVSAIVLGSLAEPLNEEIPYLLASAWQEQAHRLRTRLLRSPPAQQKPADLQQLKDAWATALSELRKYMTQHPLTADAFQTRVQAVLDLWESAEKQAGGRGGLTEAQRYLYIKGIKLLEQYAQQWQRSIAVQRQYALAMSLAEPQEPAGRAADELRRLAEQCTQARSDAALRQLLAYAGDSKRTPQAQPALREAARRLETLLDQRGAFAWTAQAALYQAQQLQARN